jgi:hypothetical protein
MDFNKSILLPSQNLLNDFPLPNLNIIWKNDDDNAALSPIIDLENPPTPQYSDHHGHRDIRMQLKQEVEGADDEDLNSINLKPSDLLKDNERVMQPEKTSSDDITSYKSENNNNNAPIQKQLSPRKKSNTNKPISCVLEKDVPSSDDDVIITGYKSQNNNNNNLNIPTGQWSMQEKSNPLHHHRLSNQGYNNFGVKLRDKEDKSYNQHPSLEELRQEYAHSCQVCNRCFKSLKELKKHHDKNHGNPISKPYSCRCCNKRFRTNQEKIRHERHQALHVHQCNVCYKRFRRKPRLEQHIVVQHYGYSSYYEWLAAQHAHKNRI